MKSRRHIGHGQVLAGAVPTQGGTSCSFGDPESLCESKEVLLTFCTNIRSLGTVVGTRTPAGAAFIIMVSGELGSAEVAPHLPRRREDLGAGSARGMVPQVGCPWKMECQGTGSTGCRRTNSNTPSHALTISKKEREEEGLGRELSLQREDSVMTLLFLLIVC